MSENKQDELPQSGGSYVRSPDGVLTLEQEPTKDHPEGNQARDRHGKPLVFDVPGEKKKAPTSSAAGAVERPAEKKGGVK